MSRSRWDEHRWLLFHFSDHLCQQFLDHGYDFFALDLRKCGRSIISPNQDLYKHYFRSIEEYNEEITLSIEYILRQAQGRSKKLILYGHSTGKDFLSILAFNLSFGLGGLVVSRYGSTGPRHDEIDAMILNSPYLAPLNTSIGESVLLGMLMKLGLSKDLEDK